MKNHITQQEKDFVTALLALKTEEECIAFLEDICTIKEIQDISQRLVVARMLNEGEKYQNIEKETGASTATISRVNKCLAYGSGGYKTVLERMQAKKEEN